MKLRKPDFAIAFLVGAVLLLSIYLMLSLPEGETLAYPAPSDTSASNECILSRCQLNGVNSILPMVGTP